MKKIKTLINKNSKDTIPDNLYIQDSLIDKSDRAQAFNDFFASIGSDISKSIPSVEGNSFYKYLKEPIRFYLLIVFIFIKLQKIIYIMH